MALWARAPQRPSRIATTVSEPQPPPQAHGPSLTADDGNRARAPHRPSRPELPPVLSSQAHMLLGDMWHEDPFSRPSLGDVLSRLEELGDTASRGHTNNNGGGGSGSGSGSGGGQHGTPLRDVTRG